MAGSIHEEDGAASGAGGLLEREVDIDKSELRTDPEDDTSYTWAEFKAAKLDEYSLEELIEYWFEEMKPDFPEGTKVVATNLSPSVSDEVLTKAFGQVGGLAFCQVYYDANEESKGFAKLQFATVEAAEAAVKRWHGVELGGQKIQVRRLMDAGRSAMLYVGGLHPSTPLLLLEEAFAEVGQVVNVTMENEHIEGRRSSAKVEFIAPEQVDQACRRFHLTKIDGKKVCCLPWKEKLLSGSGRMVRIHGPSVSVARLSVKTNPESLRQLFARVDGMVVCSIRMISDRESGYSRGLAHVEVGDEGLVRLAVDKLHGAELDGSRILVQPFDADGRPPRLPTVMCRYLSPATTATRLRDHFAKFNCHGAKILLDRFTGKPRGSGVAEFHDEESARAASEALDQSQLDGATIQVNYGFKRVPSVHFLDVRHGDTEKSLMEFFSAAVGDVYAVSIVNDGEASTPLRKAVVAFTSEKAKVKALELNGTEFAGRQVLVRDATKSDQFGAFVAGLDSRTTSEGLLRHFAHCGQVLDARVLLHRDTGESKCLGKVLFKSEEALRRAIEECNGSLLDGKAILVAEDDGGPQSLHRGAGHEFAVFVAGLHQDTSATTIRSFFEECGRVQSVNIFRRRDGLPRGCAKVVFHEEDAARLAVKEWHGAELEGVSLVVKKFAVGPGGVGSGAVTDAAKIGEQPDLFPLFVGGISQEATDEDLQALFRPFGRINIHRLGRSGAAKVSLASEEQCRRAEEALHLSTFCGRSISVVPFLLDGGKGASSRRRPLAGKGPADLEVRSTMLSAIVKGFGPETTERELKLHLSDYGEVVQVSISMDRDSRAPRCSARAFFQDEVEMRTVIEEADGSFFNGSRISIRAWEPHQAEVLRRTTDEVPPARAAPVRSAAQAAAEELRVDPEDGLAYTWREFQQRHGHRISPSELLDSWKFDCSVARPGAPRGSVSEVGVSNSVSGSSKALPQSGRGTSRSAPALDIKDWLSAVDGLWLRRMDAAETVPAGRGARSCCAALSEKFGSLDQILSLYAEHLPSGQLSLKDAFFDDCGIKRLGHKRLMKRWVAENA